MAKQFQGTRTAKPQRISELMPHGPDNKYFPYYFVHPEHGWECKPHPTWKAPKTPPTLKGLDQETIDGAAAWKVRPDHPWVWLPVLKTFQLKPGVHGVRMAPKGGRVPRTSQAIAFAKEDMGVEFVPWEAYPDGYLVEYEGDRGIVYADVWTEISLVKKGQRRSTYHSFGTEGCPAIKDGVPWDAWRLSLLTKGVLREPDRVGMRQALKIQSARAMRHISKEDSSSKYRHFGIKERYKLDKMQNTPAMPTKKAA